MPQSKAYGVKSNAARAAAKFGLTRNDLVSVEGGWAFEMPASATESIASAPEPQPAADAAPTTDTLPASAKAPESAPVKPKRRTVAEANANLKAARAAAKGKHKAKPVNGTKRKAGAKTGKTAEFLAECRARWVNSEDAQKRYGWTNNTLRGVLGINKLKTKQDFERKKIDGVTHYRLLPLAA